MNSVALFVMAFVAFAYSEDIADRDVCTLGNNVDIFGDFSAEYALQWQDVSIKNKKAVGADDWTNALYDVSFRVKSNGVLASYGGNGRALVGDILASVTGWGRFRALSLPGGSATIEIKARYRLTPTGEFEYACKSFTYNTLNLKRSEPEFHAEDLVARSLDARNNEVSILPSDGFDATDSQTTWNSVYFDNGSVNITSITWTVVPNDLGVTIGYPGAGNTIAGIKANTRHTTSISITGGEGDYTVNITLKYKKASTGATWQYSTASRPLTIQGTLGTSSLKRVADVENFKQRSLAQSEAQAGNGVQLVRADYALGVAVAGIALVAVVAVVAAMAVIRSQTKKFEIVA